MAVEEKDVSSRAADEKRKALNLAIAQIEKTCGKGAIMRMGQDSWTKVDAIPTGAINLDAAIGIGGIHIHTKFDQQRDRLKHQRFAP